MRLEQVSFRFKLPDSCALLIKQLNLADARRVFTQRLTVDANADGGPFHANRGMCDPAAHKQRGEEYS
ncbi:MAG TPA: hypothetical protein VNM92_06690 [Thermoanaerobaculia bacterium]|nr:hypothetical protein [Thermoanaerobaculia bacterium]